MRRIVSITLLLLVSLPLLSPLFAASGADSTLPACCRRDGKHHCAMMSTELGLSNSDSVHRVSVVREKCPWFPVMVQTAAVHLFSPPHHRAAFTVLHNSLATRIAQTEALYRISFDRSRQKRGPPRESPSLS